MAGRGQGERYGTEGIVICYLVWLGVAGWGWLGLAGAGWPLERITTLNFHTQEVRVLFQRG